MLHRNSYLVVPSRRAFAFPIIFSSTVLARLLQVWVRWTKKFHHCSCFFWRTSLSRRDARTKLEKYGRTLPQSCWSEVCEPLLSNKNEAMGESWQLHHDSMVFALPIIITTCIQQWKLNRADQYITSSHKTNYSPLQNQKIQLNQTNCQA